MNTKDRVGFTLAIISIVLAVACVVSAISEWNAGTFDRAWAIHSILMWAWLIDTALAIFSARFKWKYLLLLLLAPLAVWPIPTWMFILFRVLKMPFAP
jgi:hypothetical protein